MIHTKMALNSARRAKPVHLRRDPVPPTFSLVELARSSLAITITSIKMDVL